MNKFDIHCINEEAFSRLEDYVDNFSKIAHIKTDLMFGNTAERKEDVYLSLIIPTFNRSSLLEEAIYSALRQQAVPYAWELIVVDNTELDEKNNHKNIEFNQAFQKSNRAYASLEEAKQKEFIIPIIGGTFQKVRGTLLDNQLFAHNGGKFTKWTLSDVASGLSIKSFFPSLAECKKFVEEMPEQLKAEIEEKRQTSKYKEIVDKIASLNIDEVEYKDITEDAKLSMREAFDALDEEEEQISLFDL